MKQANASPVAGQEKPAPPPSKSTRRRIVIKVCLVILALALVLARTLFRIYRTDTHHVSRISIWWPERGRNLIPATATDITLRRDLLDHYAIYTVSEKDLRVFLDKSFGPGMALSERSPVTPAAIGKAIDSLGWLVTEDTVIYSYTASNGGVHSYWHDTKTGSTYQSSAYW